MKFNVKKLTSLLTASLLTAGGLVGLSAVPAFATDAAAPALLFDFESSTLVQSPWNSLPGFNFSQAEDNGAYAHAGWTNYVADAEKTGGSVGSTKMLKAHNGSGAYSGAYLVKTNTSDSLLSAAQPVVSMKFWAPAAGKIVSMTIEHGDYPSNTGTISVNASATTVSGWQTLRFDFSAANPNYTLVMNRAYIRYDGASNQDATADSATADFYVDDVAFNGISTQQQQQQQTPTVNYDVRLVSSQKNTATDANEWTFCGGAGWCANNNYYFKMIAAGGSTTLNYVVTNHATSAVVSGATVHLRMNTAYSGSNATWSSGSDTFGTVSTGTATDGGFITGTTNSSGEVSFTFANTNSNGEAVRTLNNATPYPSGCDSPAGQTKGALQPEVTAVSGAVVGTQYVDVLWPHISSSTINSSIAAGSDGTNCTTVSSSRPGKKIWQPSYDPNNKGHYPHVRLEKSFLNDKFDASWWDGVWQYRDVDTQAYLKYIPVGSTFALTYWVTNDSGQPMADAKVSLIVNANYSCSKTFFAYEGSLIGPDDCAGGGQTELPAKSTDAQGKVTFVLTNTNASGEAMPSNLSGLPNGKELGTNIKPHVVGATQEGIDMLFAHFVEPSGAAKVATSGNASPVVGTGKVSTFTFTDDSGAPIAGTDVKYFINGFDSRVGFARTDSTGRVSIPSTNSAGQAGTQTVGVSLTRDGKLPLTATVTLNWTAPELAVQASGDKRAVTVKVAGAAGKAVRITIAGKTFTRVAGSQNAVISIATTAGKKAVKVVVEGKTVSKSVIVTK